MYIQFMRTIIYIIFMRHVYLCMYAELYRNKNLNSIQVLRCQLISNLTKKNSILPSLVSNIPNFSYKISRCLIKKNWAHERSQKKPTLTYKEVMQIVIVIATHKHISPYIIRVLIKYLHVHLVHNILDFFYANF